LWHLTCDVEVHRIEELPKHPFLNNRKHLRRGFVYSKWKTDRAHLKAAPASYNS
jgi:hypothetical protein